MIRVRDRVMVRVRVRVRVRVKVRAREWTRSFFWFVFSVFYAFISL